jgi:hypothetical protein
MRSPRTKEDLSTVLGQLDAHETLEVEALTLSSIFGDGELAQAMLAAGALGRAIQFATEHNCRFDYDGYGSGSFGVFVKMPPVGAVGIERAGRSAKPV